MADEPTKFERPRVEKVRLNEDLAAQLSETTSAKRKRGEKKIRPPGPAIRRSFRTRGTPPAKMSRPVLGPLKFRDTCNSDVEAFTEAVLSLSNGSEQSGAGIPNKKSLTLGPRNIARVVTNRVYAVKFFPTHGLEMIAVGNEFGSVGFWNMKTESNSIYPFKLHSDLISGILIHPFSMSKIYTSSYDGTLRAMNIEKQVFDLAYEAPPCVSIYSLAQKPDNSNSMYMGEGQDGVVNLWDNRVRKIPSSWKLHGHRINSIDFKPSDTMIMATSSNDETACIWDLRKMCAKKSVALREIKHERAVQSAYFSPSGTHLATTSIDETIGVSSGKNLEDVSKIGHFNPPGRRLSKFKAIWGWDDEHLYVGNMSYGVDIVSVSKKETVSTMRSELMTTIPCRFDAHLQAGALAGAAAGGKVYVWTPPS